MIDEKEQMLEIENQDDVPLSCQVVYGEAEIVSIPICGFCKNRLHSDKDSKKCKAYNVLPENYLFEHEKRDCKKFQLDKNGMFYKYFKHILKRD